MRTSRPGSDELQGLEGIVTAIDLGYQRSHASDEFGNDFRYWSRLERPRGSSGAIDAVNVFFVQE